MAKIFTTEIDIRTIRNEPLKSDLETAFGRNHIVYVDFEISEWEVLGPEPEIGVLRSRYEPLEIRIFSILNQEVDSSYSSCSRCARSHEVISEANVDVSGLSSLVRKHIEELCIEDSQDNDWAFQTHQHWTSIRAEHQMEAAREREMD